jgi:hypothetical protein
MTQNGSLKRKKSPFVTRRRGFFLPFIAVMGPRLQGLCIHFNTIVWAASISGISTMPAGQAGRLTAKAFWGH